MAESKAEALKVKELNESLSVREKFIILLLVRACLHYGCEINIVARPLSNINDTGSLIGALYALSKLDMSELPETRAKLDDTLAHVMADICKGSEYKPKEDNNV